MTTGEWMNEITGTGALLGLELSEMGDLIQCSSGNNYTVMICMMYA